MTTDGQVLLQLRHRWSDGTTHLVFDPLELLERLAVIAPRPRINLILYHGILAPRARWRRQVVGQSVACQPGDAGRVDLLGTRAAPHGTLGAASVTRSDSPIRSWASLMQRVFGYDVLSCPRCGQMMRLIALIEQADVIRRILGHLGLPTDVPEPAPARAPPRGYDLEDSGGGLVGGGGGGLAAVRIFEPAIDDPC